VLLLLLKLSSGVMYHRWIPVFTKSFCLCECAVVDLVFFGGIYCYC